MFAFIAVGTVTDFGTSFLKLSYLRSLTAMSPLLPYKYGLGKYGRILLQSSIGSNSIGLQPQGGRRCTSYWLPADLAPFAPGPRSSLISPSPKGPTPCGSSLVCRLTASFPAC